MHIAHFDQPETIDSQSELARVFQTESVKLGNGARVVMAGEITLEPNVIFYGNSEIHGPVSIGAGSVLTNVRMGARSIIRPCSILRDLQAGMDNVFGPFCFIRDGCIIGNHCILAAHVEAARSTFADHVKVSHRAFIGDARIGAGSIVGAGVIFCNYDGASRQCTTVGSRTTLGSGTLLVPPISIGSDVLIAAGSTITRDVPDRTKIIQKKLTESSSL